MVLGIDLLRLMPELLGIYVFLVVNIYDLRSNYNCIRL